MAGPHAESEAEVLGHHDRPDPLAGRKLQLHIVTPTGNIIETRVDEVTATGVSGEFGVLPGHVPLMAALRAGVLTYRDGATRQIYAAGPGHAHVGAGEMVRILISRAEKAENVDLPAARADLEKLTSELKGADTSADDHPEKQARLDWAQARVDAAEKAGAPKEH